MKKIFTAAAALILSIGAVCAQTDNVEVRLDVQKDKAIAGDVFLANVFISKGAITGFARFHVDFPDGIEAEQVNVDNADAVFSFDDQRMRFIWANLPPQPAINVSFRIRVTDRYTGSADFQITGKFTYVVGDERKSVEATSTTLQVLPRQASAENNPPVAANNDAAAPPTSPTPATPVASAQPTPAPPATSSAPTPVAPTPAAPAQQPTPATTVAQPVVVNAYAVRQTPYLVDKSYYVNIRVERDNLTGYGKIEESLNSYDSQVEPIETKGAQFRVEGNKVIFSWEKLPQEQAFFVIAYKIIPNQPGTRPTIRGRFEYANGASLDSKVISERDVDYSSFVPVPSLAEAQRAALTPAKPAPPQMGLVFKVQLLARSQPIANVDAYFSPFNLGKRVTEEVVTKDYRGGSAPYKYVIGPFKTYEQAKINQRTAQQNGIRDAFVTCYYNGERITVQEAQMLSNRKY